MQKTLTRVNKSASKPSREHRLKCVDTGEVESFGAWAKEIAKIRGVTEEVVMSQLYRACTNFARGNSVRVYGLRWEWVR